MSSCVDRAFSGQCLVSIYGAGYVGLSLAAVYVRKGLRIILVDIDEHRLKMISEGRFNFVERDVEEAIVKGLREGRVYLTSNGVEASRESCIKVVTVPVYFNWSGKRYSFDALINVSRTIGLGLKRDDLVIIESSVPPGTTFEIVKPILEETSRLRVEHDFYLAYSPERIFVGRAVKDIEENYPKIVSGVGSKSLELVAGFYGRIAVKGVIKLSNTTAAEFEKLAEGIYRDVNIALANELALAALRLGIDYYEVREAANSQPYCHLHLPGPGVGGYCIPLYPYFVMNKLLMKGFVMDLTRTARFLNENMPLNIVMLVEQAAALLDFNPSSSKVVVLGDAFRGDVDDTRNSPSHDIVSLLKGRGFNNIVVHDPYVSHDDFLEKLEIVLSRDLASALRGSHIVIVATRHSQYRGLRVSDVLRFSGGEPLIIDTVNYLHDDVGYDKLIVLGRSTVLTNRIYGV